MVVEVNGGVVVVVEINGGVVVMLVATSGGCRADGWWCGRSVNQVKDALVRDNKKIMRQKLYCLRVNNHEVVYFLLLYFSCRYNIG